MGRIVVLAHLTANAVPETEPCAKVETALRCAYFLSVAFSPLGPVVHYTLWSICLLILLYELVARKTSLKLEGVSPCGWAIFALLSAAALWTMAAGLFSFQQITSYGRNVTPLLEVVFGAYLAMRTMRGEKARRQFVYVFLAASVVIMLGNILRAVGLLSYFPNRSLMQTNSLGGLGLLLFPPVVCGAFWSVGEKWWIKLPLVLSVCYVVLLSFSSGAWLSTFLGALVLAYYILRSKKLTVRFCVLFLTAFLACGAACNMLTQGKQMRLLQRELGQITAIGDVDKLTTYRSQIWTAAWQFIKERPVLGHGGESFFSKYAALRGDRQKAKELGLTWRSADQPHSLYLYLLYIGGVPALVLFVAALLAALARMIPLARREKDVFFPWAAASVALLVEILTYGTNGDVLQGRRDISVLVWFFFGVMAVLPAHAPDGNEKTIEKPRDGGAGSVDMSADV